MTNQLLKTASFKLKGRLYTLTVMHLMNGTLDIFTQQLKQTIAQAPRLFQSISLVLDCSELDEASVDLLGIVQCLRDHQLFPVAVQGTADWVVAFAQRQGLAVLTGSASHDKEWVETEALPDTTIVPSVASNRTKCHAMPVRSGQQLVSKDSDLLVLGSVSPGAELLSEGNIYVYGALRGRALAGMSGDKHARIFCQSLKAELISIAGVYRLSESMDAVAGPCQIYLHENRIVVEPICLTVG
ncbi:MAG: septum site-determining protein MinC [Gammaproteobacteria bacterium]|nr:septum site-determining protein MinC [Gammaproteobacteria bacterium]